MIRERIPSLVLVRALMALCGAQYSQVDIWKISPQLPKNCYKGFSADSGMV